MQRSNNPFLSIGNHRPTVPLPHLGRTTTWAPLALCMAQAVSKQRDRKRVSEARQERDIAIYQSHMRGNSQRAIQEEFSIKSCQTVHAAIQRGRELVKERGIDTEERRIEIDQLFANTLGMLAAEVSRQSAEGRIQTIERSDGTSEIRRTKGIDPRTAEALARSADRWAQFLGVTDRAAEVSSSTTLIQLSAPTDGASFTDRWSQPAIEVEASPALEAGGQSVEIPAVAGNSEPCQPELAQNLEQMALEGLSAA